MSVCIWERKHCSPRKYTADNTMQNLSWEDKRWLEAESLWAHSLACSLTLSSFWILTGVLWPIRASFYLSLPHEWYSLSAWPCHCLCNPWIRPLLCIYTDNIDKCLEASFCAKVRKKMYSSCCHCIFSPLGIILFILGRIWIFFAFGTWIKCSPIDMKLFYCVMICQWVEIKGPETVLQNNSQMLHSLPARIFTQLFSSIRFKMN